MALIGNIEQFNSKETEISSYIERLEQLFNCNDISTEVKKVSVLIAVIGGEAYGVLKDLVAPALPSEKKYVELVEALKKHYSPKRLIIAERYRFHTAHQEQHEDIRSFVARLKNLAKFCDFSTFLDDSLRDRLVCGLKSESIKRRLLTEESLTFEKAYTAALGMELAEGQLKVMGPEFGQVNKVNNILVSYVPPEKEPVFAATDDGSDDGSGAGDDCAFNVDIDSGGCCDYVVPEEQPELKFVDVDADYRPLKDDDGNGVDANGYRDCDPLEGEREADFAATDSRGGDGGASDDRAPNTTVITDDCDDDYDPPKDEPELVVVATSTSVNIDDCYGDYDPPKMEPELVVVLSRCDATDTDSSQNIVYECSHCGIGLSTREFKVEHDLRCKVRLTQKELESQVTEVYHCGYCRCPFVDKKHKEQHQRKWCPKRRVLKKRSFLKCDKCEFVTNRNYNLRDHLLTHNKNNAEWFTCTQCSYKTVHRGYMTKHTNVTHQKGVGIKKYECPLCSYSTFYKGHLTKHSKRHAVQKNHQCAGCKKWFTRKTNLDSHILKNHASEVDLVTTVTSKIHHCELCSYKTIQKNRLEGHVRTKHN